MSAKQKVSAQEFTVDTDLSPEEIREAGQRAAEAGTEFMGCKIHEHGVSKSVIGYAIDGFGISGRQMELAVGWEELKGGKRRATLEVGEGFATNRMVLLGFIPLGSASPTAIGPLKRFSERLRKDLSWTN